jgi:hypothetical protein
MGELLALLSYNGGMTRVRRWRAARPALNDALFLETVEFAETREYGRQVLAAAAITPAAPQGRRCPRRRAHGWLPRPPLWGGRHD